MPDIAINVVPHDALTSRDLVGLRQLFDAEYLDDFGEWDPDMPYGYAPHAVHVIAQHNGETVGHIGWSRRTVAVGDDEVEIAGVGGVLISDAVRGERIGSRLMASAAEAMKAASGIAFGYLGCREEVVSFYTSCGWIRISATEHSIDTSGRPSEDPPGQPLLILPVEVEAADWPVGAVDLRGRAW
ncbi:GNAT family N-acetyltransferase [Microbacterium sp. Mu-80]|uniref:GNAT family N-acetyltransferase n=1 Tax=Microbacterium bandirmense TaxID=3122050 RepID=A0ABU8L7H3_9MICO